jgi:hypothetical protein
MRSIPYGYRIENGKAFLNEEEAKKVRAAFARYADGDSMYVIQRELKIDRYHRGISKLLEDQKYRGTDFYPAIVDEELFNRVQKVRVKRKKEHARPPRKRAEPVVAMEFVLKSVKQQMKDPFAQAQYVYKQIQMKE